MGLTAVCCIPKLYWMPKNPKFISKIWRVVISGLRVGSTRSAGADVGTAEVPVVGRGSCAMAMEASSPRVMGYRE
jgi:hypothetical protein